MEATYMFTDGGDNYDTNSMHTADMLSHSQQSSSLRT